MARMTEHAWAYDGVLDRGAEAGPIAARVLRRLSLSLLVIALLGAGALSATAAGRVNSLPLAQGAIATAETATVPKVTTQPVSITVEEGLSASFNAVASGKPAPTVQWERSTDAGVTWSPIAGATSVPLAIAAVKSSENGYRFRALFTNSAGVATSKPATLTVRKVPAVTAQPSSITVEEGQNAVFEAAASGFPTPTVQWETSTDAGLTWSNVAGATSARLTVTSVKPSNNDQRYRAAFKNTAGAATSESATLTVRKLPAVTKQPLSVSVLEGQSVIFEATASGFPAPTEQWEISTNNGASWQPFAGATSTQLTIATASTAEDGTQYRAFFQNAAGTAMSAAATLTVRALPVVTQQPASTTVEVGQGATFEAAASGYPVPTVQWEVSSNGGSTWGAISGATSDHLAIATTVAAETGYEYRAVFANAAGKATSASATLTVAATHYNATAWGQNLSRQLGDGSVRATSDVPVDVVGLRFVTAVAAGGTHSLALLADHTVVAWGGNTHGQLGDGALAASNVPVSVTGLGGVKAIAAGGSHSLALLANGTVMAWGNNESGQLGNATRTDSEVPVAVQGLTGVRAVSAGGEHSLALLNNGTVMAWGANESGQLGTGGTKSSPVPVAIQGLTGVSAISAGGDFSLSVLANGTVKAWGSDELGQLDNAAGVESGASTVPVPAEGLAGVTAVAAGTSHGLALLGSGSVVAWGSDSAGELGNGVITAREEAPVPVSGLSGVTAISAGGQLSAALLGSGSIMTWGTNAWGALGDALSGSPGDVPVAVRGLQKAASVSVGGLHMLAYGEPTPTITSVSPSVGPATGGTAVTISGTAFTGATAVRFGSVEASSVTVESGSSITATAPAGTGTVDVTVVTPAGLSPTAPADRYTFVSPPTVTKLVGKSGPTAGGTVTISGTQFIGTTGVSFGGVAASSFTVNSATSITAVAPAAATAGTVDVVVGNVAGSSAISSKDRFKYVPVAEGISPNTGSTLGGETVTVTGVGFGPGATATIFKFGTVKAKSVSCLSTVKCTVVAPAGVAGTVAVTAMVDKAVSAASDPGDQFTYS